MQTFLTAFAGCFAALIALCLIRAFIVGALLNMVDRYPSRRNFGVKRRRR